jgi:hypothetical protein
LFITRVIPLTIGTTVAVKDRDRPKAAYLDLYHFHHSTVHYRRDRNDTVGESKFTFLQPKIDKYNGRPKTQDAEDSFSSAIQSLESCVLSLESWV